MQYKSGKPPEEKKCVVCGKPFLVGGRGRPPRKTARCSLACQQAGRYRHGAIANQLTVAAAAYLAGIVDGEGTIGIYGYGYRTPAAHLSVANTYLPLLEWIQDEAGLGAIVNRKVRNQLHKQGYVWQCSSQAAGSLITQIRPYLRIKGEQADAALALLDGLTDPARKADLGWQRDLMDRCRHLNRRGPECP